MLESPKMLRGRYRKICATFFFFKDHKPQPFYVNTVLIKPYLGPFLLVLLEKYYSISKCRFCKYYETMYVKLCISIHANLKASKQTKQNKKQVNTGNSVQT